tara:strand:+ start:72 stop:572 length:501 start_codon:yes stop_codon:yes gene_type:complete
MLSEAFMITKEIALQDFEYKDGNLYHKIDRKNQINAGDLAGGLNSSGYKIVRIGGERHLVHRVVFLMHHGHLPNYVDHIDNDPLNNKIENLRECTFSQNRCNTPKYKNNKSGEKGVVWEKSSGKWVATIQYLKERTYVGRYLEIKDAIHAIREKRKEIHGTFTNNN